MKRLVKVLILALLLGFWGSAGAALKLAVVSDVHIMDPSLLKHDVETGSLVSYPSPIRIVSIDGRRVAITTEQVSGCGIEIPGGQSLNTAGYDVSPQ